MKLLSHVLLLLVLVACVAAAPGAGPAAGRGVGAPPATRPALDIYLLMGQSNMVGRDTSTLAGQVDDPRILAFTAENEWVVAREPITPQVRSGAKYLLPVNDPANRGRAGASRRNWDTGSGADTSHTTEPDADGNRPSHRRIGWHARSPSASARSAAALLGPVSNPIPGHQRGR